jgi:hypothetical protein
MSASAAGTVEKPGKNVKAKLGLNRVNDPPKVSVSSLVNSLQGVSS